MVLFELIGICICVCVIYYYIYTNSIERNYKFSTPFKIPLIGNPYILFLYRNKDTVVNFRGYGKKATTKKRIFFWIGPWLNFIVLDPEDIAQVIKSSKSMTKAYQYRFFEPWLGDCILLSSGQKFQQHKKILVQTFHVNNLKQYIPIYNDSAGLLMKNVEHKLGLEEFDIYQYLSLCTMHTFLETTLGIDRNLIGNEAFTYAQAIGKVARYAYIRASNAWMYSDFLFNFTKLKKKQDELVKMIHSLTERIISEKRNEYEERLKLSYTENDYKHKKTFVEYMFEAIKDNGQKLTEKEIKDEVLVMLFAAQDTTTASLGFLITLLGIFGDIQDKVFEELDGIYGDSDRAVTYDDTFNFKYMEQVIQESWRLFPPFPMIGKYTTEDVPLDDDCVIPKGTNLALSIMSLHRNKNVYSNPKQFNPDNFLPEEIRKRNPLNFLPFSAGYRACIGQKYSTLLIKVIIATLLRNYRISCTSKLEDIKLVLEATMSRKGGYLISIERRKKAE